ncbi:TPA: type 1 fimbrial protein [Klebsiella oxytoca]|nr:type 1 fimbrial protein [Klebsiella oxytoca]
MKVNKQIFFATAVLMIAFTGVIEPALAGDNTTVTITGTVRANTCTVGDTASGELAPVSVRDFEKTAGKVVGSATVPVVFSDCGGGTTGVKVSVSGTAAGSNGAFKNANDGVEGGAKNVGVYFYDTDGSSLIKAGTSVAAKEQNFTTDTTLYYKASYVAITDDVGAGSVLTTITMNFTYF